MGEGLGVRDHAGRGAGRIRLSTLLMLRCEAKLSLEARTTPATAARRYLERPSRLGSAEHLRTREEGRLGGLGANLPARRPHP
jgi:hypothetical protein